MEEQAVTFEALDELYDAMMRDDPRITDKFGQWSSDLPTFGGVEPVDDYLVWSWDEHRVIYGHDRSDLVIMGREEWLQRSGW